MSKLYGGLNQGRLVDLMRAAIRRSRLELCGAVVLTEAASGAYVVTPVLAAMAGAKQVFAITRTTRHGTAEEIAAQTLDLAQQAGFQARIEVIHEKTREIMGQADIVTNSGHVRPIDATAVAWMKPTAVIPLMYEAWEFRTSDVDLEACRRHGIAVAGTNERHPALDVFSYLGIMAVKLLADAGIAVYRSRVLVLCDNPFAPFIQQGLTQAGATAEVAGSLLDVAPRDELDAIVVALRPRAIPVLGTDEAIRIAERWPGTVVVQFWGDVDRQAMGKTGVPYWPIESPPQGHMGILPSALGPELVVRLQAGGLKVGQIMLDARQCWSHPRSREDVVAAAVRSGFGQAVHEHGFIDPRGGSQA